MLICVWRNVRLEDPVPGRLVTTHLVVTTDHLLESLLTISAELPKGALLSGHRRITMKRSMLRVLAFALIMAAMACVPLSNGASASKHAVDDDVLSRCIGASGSCTGCNLASIPCVGAAVIGGGKCKAVSHYWQFQPTAASVVTGCSTPAAREMVCAWAIWYFCYDSFGGQACGVDTQVECPQGVPTIVDQLSNCKQHCI